MTSPLRVVADITGDAERRYEVAKARREEVQVRRDAIQVAWEEQGCLLLSTGSTGQQIEHPLVKMLRDHEVLLQQHDSLLLKLAEPLQKRHRGPAPSAVVQASIGHSPAAKLRRPA